MRKTRISLRPSQPSQETLKQIPFPSSFK